MDIDTNYNYVVELQDEKIPQIKKEIKSLEDEKAKIERTRKSWHRLGLPPSQFAAFDYSNVFSWIFERGESEFIHEMKDVIRHYDVDKPLIDSKTFDIIDTALCIIVPVIGVVLIPRDYLGWWLPKVLDVCAMTCFSVAILKVLEAIFFIEYYSIGIRRKVFSKLRRRQRQIKSELGIKSKQLASWESLIEQYKISTLDTGKSISDIKQNTIDELRRTVEKTVEEVLPKVANKKVHSKYASILSKCADILNIATYNGSIVSEISQIFNVYIPEINNLIIIFGSRQPEKILELLDNFERHIEDKIEQTSKSSQFEFESRVGALKKSILAAQGVDEGEEQ